MRATFYFILLFIFVASCDSSNSSSDDLPEPTIPTLITTEITNVSYNSATSGGNQLNGNNGEITQKGVCWAVQPNSPTIDDAHTNDGTGTAPFSSYLTDLEPNTSYFVRSYAINEAGIGYGEKLFVTTIHAPGTAPCNPSENSVTFNATTIDFSSTTVNSDPQYGFYGIAGISDENFLHIEFKESPLSGVYETVEVGSFIFSSNCVLYGRFSDFGGEDFVAAAEDLVYVTHNGENQYSITFCDVVLYSTTSNQSFAINANLKLE